LGRIANQTKPSNHQLQALKIHPEHFHSNFIVKHRRMTAFLCLHWESNSHPIAPIEVVACLYRSISSDIVNIAFVGSLWDIGCVIVWKVEGIEIRCRTTEDLENFPSQTRCPIRIDSNMNNATQKVDWYAIASSNYEIEDLQIGQLQEYEVNWWWEKNQLLQRTMNDNTSSSPIRSLKKWRYVTFPSWPLFERQAWIWSVDMKIESWEQLWSGEFRLRKRLEVWVYLSQFLSDSVQFPLISKRSLFHQNRITDPF
jgi:hypothetical protein